MSNASNNSTNTVSSVSTVVGFSYSVRFWLLLIPNILSIVCSIFLLYHLLFNRNLRHALNNHVIIILLILGLFFELTDVSWTIHYYHFGYTLIQTPAFALLWTFIDYAVFNCQTMLFAWATIERHILIFHDRWVATRMKRLLVHYLPIIFILTYYSMYYSVLFFVPFCINTFDYSRIYGMSSVHCVYRNPVVPKFAIFSQGILPTLIILIFSYGLLSRVLWQRTRLRQSINWRKQRKMIIQLLSISIIYLVLYAPYILLYLAYNLGLSRSIGTQFATYFPFFAYYIPFLLPFVCCFSLPQLRIKIKNLFFWQQQHRIIHPRT